MAISRKLYRHKTINLTSALDKYFLIVRQENPLYKKKKKKKYLSKRCLKINLDSTFKRSIKILFFFFLLNPKITDIYIYCVCSTAGLFGLLAV